jgi:hypothetical protein
LCGGISAWCAGKPLSGQRREEFGNHHSCSEPASVPFNPALSQSRKTFAIVLYPWCAFCILFWAGYNVMFDGRITELVKMAVALTVYDRFMLRQVHQQEDAEARVDADNLEVDILLRQPVTQGFAGDYFSMRSVRRDVDL